MNPNKLQPIRTASSMAHFVMERMTGGGWSALPHAEPSAPVRPVRAAIAYLQTPDVQTQPE